MPYESPHAPGPSSVPANENAKGEPRPELHFMVTSESPCPYLPDRYERKLLTDLHGRNAAFHHSRLSQAGFRRSHHYAYRPACRGCNACVPVRVAVDRFIASKSQRRIYRKNADLEPRFRPAMATREQYRLFSRYLQARHRDGEMAEMTFSDYRAMIEDTNIRTEVLELRDANDNLRGACLTDVLDDGLSAVYSFFTPEDEKRSLGRYFILMLIEEALRRKLPYLYLGYWIAQSRKMAYKTDFRPIEALKTNGWSDLEDT
ncbi:arginyltransferase [Fodinicurvata fenggangensis]|uniref:arginyltransferase n=1 Tax=Fodinicurvata fenggangensis TaxID=1121830 RepID=UPI0009DCCD02|nr:arginyltransferase [Fodinicurvata fenggangensis]